jgi:hypothetical protein
MGVLTMNIVLTSRRLSKPTQKTFFLVYSYTIYIDLKKKWVSYQLASGTQGICDLFAEFIDQTYVDDSWFPSSSDPDFVNDELCFSLMFSRLRTRCWSWIIAKVQARWHTSADSENSASAFALSLCMLFNMSLVTYIVSDRWKLSFVTPISKSDGRNDISNYRSIAKLSAIAKLFELLVYRVYYEKLILHEKMLLLIKGFSCFC